MTLTRRKFLRAGTVAALAAGIPLESALAVFGQGNRKERDANPGDGTSLDPLSYYTKSAFQAYLNSTFLLKAGNAGTVPVVLTEVADSGSGSGPGGQECFSLLFKNGRGPSLAQGTYAVEHAALGTFALFLVPGGGDRNGGQSYVAVINRVGNSPALFAAPVGRAKSLETVKSNGRSTESENTPPPVAPVAKPKKMKGAWKRGEVDELRESVLINQ